MHRYLQIFAAILVTAFALAPRAYTAPADDWSFIAGKKFAVDTKDCKALAKGRPFTKALVKAIDSEVMTREGITSQRETHCKFRSAKKDAATPPTWTVKAACEELGNVSQEDIKIAPGADGALVVTSEDVFGPPLTFLLCK
jgi:hypothetical protein